MDKLTIAPAVSLRLTERQRKELPLQAQARHMEVSDYLRHLISQDRQLLKQAFDPLSELFAKDISAASNTTNDSVSREGGEL